MSFITDAFKPKAAPMPAIPAPTPVPTIDDAAFVAAQEADSVRRRQGRASTVLSGNSGSGASGSGAVPVATKALLGS